MTSLRLPKRKNAVTARTFAARKPCWRERGFLAESERLADDVLPIMLALAKRAPEYILQAALSEALFRTCILPSRTPGFQRDYLRKNAPPPEPDRCEHCDTNIGDRRISPKCPSLPKNPVDRKAMIGSLICGMCSGNCAVCKPRRTRKQ